MGLFDKLKDLFMDEVVDDEEVELEEENKNIYQEPKDVLPKVMRDTIKKEEGDVSFEQFKPLKPLKEKEKEEVVEKREPVLQKKFSFPIDFEEEVTPSRTTNKNVLKQVEEAPKKVAELYPKKEVVEKPRFKPTPVISPVYGILDKNYKKDEVREKAEDNFEMKRPSKKVDFETVRKKAFGNLADDIKDNLMCENCELYKEVKRISSISSDDLLYDMMVDDKVEEPVTIERAYDNYEDFGVAYEPEKDTKPATQEEVVIKDNTSVSVAEKVEIKEEKKIEDSKTSPMDTDSSAHVEDDLPSRQEKKKDNKVDEDFFELIDSMYKERIDG